MKKKDEISIITPFSSKVHVRLIYAHICTMFFQTFF